jgi:hypothetical protein
VTQNQLGRTKPAQPLRRAWVQLDGAPEWLECVLDVAGRE